MERVSIRQQALEELYQTPENTLESKHRPPPPHPDAPNIQADSSS